MTSDAVPGGVSDGAANDETVILPASDRASGTDASCRSHVQFPEGAAPTAAEAYRALRQSRVRAAVLYLAGWWGVILVQLLLSGAPIIQPAIVVICLLTAFGILSRQRAVPDLGLRVIEVSSFALIAAVFVTLQFSFMRIGAEEGNPLTINMAIKNGLINSLTLLLAYTLLIPNSVRMAMPVVVGLAIYPLATAWTGFVIHPVIRQVAGPEGEFQMAGLNLTMVLIAGGLSLYGIHILDTLRQDVFEARRLNQYQLGTRLGSGGMGDVYRAEHRLLKRSCAIKLIRPDNAGDRKALARLEREVQTTAKISHPNIVDIYDYGHTDDGTFYYVMEKLHGLTLAELVQRDGPLPPARVVYLLRQACDGLAEAHAFGLIHRDLKPANIYVANIGQRYDVAKLLDFGLVKQSANSSMLERDTPLSDDGDITGTPRYMAPEQAAGFPELDHRADLYSIGCVAYYLLTGRPPFDGDSLMSILIAHARDPVTPPSKHQPVPEDLEQVVLRCLEKSPSDRFADATSLSQALTAVSFPAPWSARQAQAWWESKAS